MVKTSTASCSGQLSCFFLGRGTITIESKFYIEHTLFRNDTVLRIVGKKKMEPNNQTQEFDGHKYECPVHNLQNSRSAP